MDPLTPGERDVTRVWLETWEWACCGDPFGIGEDPTARRQGSVGRDVLAPGPSAMKPNRFLGSKAYADAQENDAVFGSYATTTSSHVPSWDTVMCLPVASPTRAMTS